MKTTSRCHDTVRWRFAPAANSSLIEGIDAVATIRDAVGPEIDLYIDCNGIFNAVGNAIRAAKAVERHNIGFFEEPVPHENLDAMEYVRSKIDIPVATGERLFTIFSFQQLLAAGYELGTANRNAQLPTQPSIRLDTPLVHRVLEEVEVELFQLVTYVNGLLVCVDGPGDPA